MKKILVSFLLMGMGLSISTAQSFTTGYAGYVLFSDGHHSSPVGDTQEECQERLDQVISSYLGSHDVSIREYLPCGPRTSTIPEVDVRAWLKLDIPPVCLSCPLLGPETFEIFYPEFTGEIKNLYYGFKINKYNQELQALQRKYDLEGFEAEVFKLNNELNQYQQ